MTSKPYNSLVNDRGSAFVKTRVLFVLPTLLAGGAERVLLTLMNHLDRDQFEPHFLVLDERGTLKSWIASDIPFYSMGHAKIRNSILKMVDLFDELEPDIIVSTMASMNFGILLTKPFLKKPPRMIVREAVIPSSIAENQIFPWLVRLAYKMLYRRADMVISPARCIITEFGKYMGIETKNYALLHNPVDIVRIRGGAEVSIPVAKRRFSKRQFVCAGRLHMQKGFDRLLDSLAEIKGRDDWELNIMGEGEEHDALQARITRLGLGTHVTLSGLEKNPWPIMARADAFLLPSRWEGLPNVVLESLAVGTPVIATAESGGIAEIAQVAQEGTVQVVESMEAFMDCVKAVKPAPCEMFRPSLLPEFFYLDAVVERFSDLITGYDIPLMSSVQSQSEGGVSSSVAQKKKTAA